MDMLPVCGRPVGLQWDRNNNLIVTDAYKGLVSINIKTGEKKILFGPKISDDVTCKFFNYPVVLSNGSIFFTCLSTNFAPHEMFGESFPLADFLWNHSLNNDTGLILHYNPTTDQTVAVRGQQLFGPNGAAKSPNEEFLLIAEMTRSRIAR